MISAFLEKAEAGQPVYISSVYDCFRKLGEDDSNTLHCMLTLFENDEQRYFPIRIPRFGPDGKETMFIREYVQAELYNILSALGGKKMDIYINYNSDSLIVFANELNTVFGIDKPRSERKGYGRCINVIDRMLDTLSPDSPKFRFSIHSIDHLPEPCRKKKTIHREPDLYKKVTENMGGKLLCGIDVGGTDIKTVLVKDGRIICYKEYDWFPAGFTTSKQLADPICLIVRLMRAGASIDSAPGSAEKNKIADMINRAMEVSASEDFMLRTCEEAEKLPGCRPAEIDGVGMCFPDVVVRNKIVGGEVYKTRGIRNNPEIDYENDFSRLTNLNESIQKLIRKDGKVLIINDGPMASFTAAVETAASGSPDMVKSGVFAHTLGTELGTGWVDEEGRIPDIPLEVYNFIIDLGSYPERKHNPDDLRSINNFNTGLPGTLQKYTSQSGVFRLAMKYFPAEAPGLFQELLDLGFVVEREVDGVKGFYVPTEPKDLRKPFLEHMMKLPERKGDEVNNRIWREIGEFLAVTWLETKKILNPLTDSRVLFGRLVKRKRCYELICEGAKGIKSDIRFEAADSDMANTALMKQLEDDPHFTVAQFAQAVGAVYFANQ